MSADKLSQWLAGEGLTSPSGKKNLPHNSSGSQKTQSKNQAPQKKQEPRKLQKKNTTSSQKNSNRNQKTRHSSSHNPTVGRPTFAKREKFHPTNFLKGGKSGDIRVVPLGGMEQVGSNMMFLEWGNDIIVIDMGLLFPSPEHLGVDMLVPDISYLIKNRRKIRGVVFTHGHLDHIGGVPYLAEELGFPPMYATKLTKELIFANSEEHGINKKLKVTEINPKSKIRLGQFQLEFFHINHSIPDGVGIVVKTPYGSLVNTSDFKIDHHPSDDQPADLGRISKIGHEGVLLAMVDSTNALRPGHSLSETVIENQLAKIVRDTNGRLIITTFASNIGRIGKIVQTAEEQGRTVFVSGRSMERNLAIAKKLNYIKYRESTIQRMGAKAEKMPPEKVLILSTGSQGEELAALTRMSAGVHRDVTLRPNDTVVFSSSPIPGNEMAVVSVMNNLAEIGVNMIDNKQLDTHVSGHGHAEEVKLMTALLNPRYFAPIHGELYMRVGHKKLAMSELGIPEERIFIMYNGRGVVINEKGVRPMSDKEAIPAKEILIELGEKLGEHTLAERTLMAKAGAIFIGIQHDKGKFKKADIRSRGFLYMDINHQIFQQLGQEMKQVFDRNYDPSRPEKALEETLRKSAQKFFYQKFKKEPLVEVVM
ncbi:ribonuclease J [Candidatus Gracilibacteria bacterium]|nr:ribonuclease J [Candidatus Gracilibacteria bacterium]MCF7819007.1 ribonuclease J [Candidatus Gracilibacteria bacterium]